MHCLRQFCASMGQFVSKPLIMHMHTQAGLHLAVHLLLCKQGICTFKCFSFPLYIITGSASSVTNLLVKCNSSLAEISFKPPVYGKKCVDYYVICAISQERNATCDNISASDDPIYNHSILLNNTVSFTVHSINGKSDDTTTNDGNITTGYCMLS